MQKFAIYRGEASNKMHGRIIMIKLQNEPHQDWGQKSDLIILLSNQFLIHVLINRMGIRIHVRA